MNDRADISWAPRLNLHEIKLLYFSCASGMYDEKLIDNVGIALYMRCESILEYTWAHESKVKCKRCHKNGTDTFILRQTKEPRELLRCPVCNWQIQWRVYLSETDKKTSGQLTAGRARRAFEEYYYKYPQCKEPNAKMMAIDQLIHEFHWTLRGELKEPVASRTACVCLLEGNATEITELLDSLTYGENTNPELLKTRDWRGSQEAIVKSRKNDLMKQQSTTQIGS